MAYDVPLPGFDSRHWVHQAHTNGAVTYEFQGTLGGDNIVVCGECGALVRAQDETDHTLFHLGPG